MAQSIHEVTSFFTLNDEKGEKSHSDVSRMTNKLLRCDKPNV